MMTTESQKDQPTPSGSPTEHSSVSARSAIATRLVSLVKLVVAVGVLVGTFWLGGRFGAPQGSLQTTGTEAQTEGGDVEYWTCSMHPQIRQPRPGRCPICGMELVPVKGGGQAPKAKKVKYACAMMCVPPQDRPGKCPVCGMDLVPVEEHGGEEASQEPSAANVLSEISLSETARKLARLQVTPVERRFVAAEIRMVGKVVYDETRQRTISSRVPGRLDRLFVDFTGVPVKQGDHLVYLYSPDLLTTQEGLLVEYRRLQQMRASNSPDLAAQESLVADAKKRLILWGITEAQVEEITQRGTPSDHMTIYAPIAGIVTEKRLVEGAYVETGTEIYTIADLSSLWVKLDAYELDLAWLRYGQEVEFTTEAYPGDAFHGTIAFIDPVLNARTRTAKVRVNVPNLDGRLKPGMFVRAVVRSQLNTEGKVMDPAMAGKWICPMHPEVVADGPDSCTVCGMPLVPAESLGYASTAPSEVQPPLVIPVTAPLITGKRAVVYVAKRDRTGRYEGREVVLGPRAGEYYLVREGLTEGELVVSQGNLYLDSAVQILAKRSMMQPEAGGTPPGHAHGGHAPAGTEAPKPKEPDPSADHAARVHIELPEAARTALDQAYDGYFAMHNALSHDQHAPTKGQAKLLLEAAETIDKASLPDGPRAEWRSLQSGLRSSAEGTLAAKNIESARAAFEGVSNSMIAVAKQFGTGRRAQLRVYHCPMAFDNRGARWMQDKEGLENPYFGSAMFTCGVWKESIEGGSHASPGGADHD